MQADQFEQLENEMQTELIDIKNSQQKIDVYDLSPEKNQQTMFKEREEIGCNTEELSAVLEQEVQDWFFTKLNRKVFEDHYIKHNLPLPEDTLY